MILKTKLIFLSIFYLTLWSCSCSDNEELITPVPAQVGDECSIYIDFESPSPALWTPDGWMGDTHAIQFNAAFDGNPHSGPECIEIIVTVTDLTEGWAGIYWLANQSWTGPGIDLREKLNLADSNTISLQFSARGALGMEKIRFFVGGVRDGNDSIDPEVGTNPSWLELSSDWQEYEIDLSGENDLTNIVGGFGWVTESDKNPGMDEIRFYLDNIRFVVTN